MKHLLHLQHRHHTGKKITHKHTSYRGLLVLVVLFGVTLCIIQQTVRASEIITTAKVAAPAPSLPAIITSHHNEEVITTPTVQFTGTCSYVAPSTAIELYIDTVFVGSSICETTGTFSLSTTISTGRHLIVVRTANVTGDYGPDSSPLHITYMKGDESQSPQTPTPPNTTSNTAPPASVAPNGVQIYSKFTYLLYGPEKDAEWVGYFSGGTAPYTVAIDWGDGTSSSYTATDSKSQTYRHSYRKYEPFFVTLTVTDADGSQTSMQLAAITPYVDSSATPGLIAGGERARIDQILLYSAYATLATLVLLGILTVYHTEYVYLHPPTHAKQYVRATRAKRGSR